MQGLNITTLADGRKAVVIRTSDRIAFKQCRRKWSWSSHLKRNLGSRHLAGPLWFGSAIHYALEDYHGWNVFGSPTEAFKAYCIATSKNHHRELPPDANDLYALGINMMDYYSKYWLPYKTKDETYWEDGIPQVEVNFELPIPIDASPIIQQHCEAQGIDVILYRGTFDGICEDEHGRLWVKEYKTAKTAMHMHYQTDPQITTYVWAAGLVYEKPVVGVIYLQYVKKEAEYPRVGASGKLSTAKNLITSGVLYKHQLERMYGEVRRAPIENVNFLAYLYGNETENTDRYVQRVQVYRNQLQCEQEYGKILLELEDMLNPELPLYPNPTRDCSRMCSFLSSCVSFDDGSDYEAELAAQFSLRDQDVDRMWRKRMPDPDALRELHSDGAVPDLEQLQADAVSIAAYRSASIEAGEEIPTEFDITNVD
jgi:hypothetical protein